MAGIRSMTVGKTYFVGDSYGYDKIECIEINPKETPKGCFGVKVRCLSSNKEEIFFEFKPPNTTIFAFFERDIFCFRVVEEIK